MNKLITDKPWFESKTVILFVASMAAAIAPILDAVVGALQGTDMLDPKWMKLLTVASIVLASIGTLTARKAGVDSSVEVMEEVKDVKRDVKAVEKQQASDKPPV